MGDTLILSKDRRIEDEARKVREKYGPRSCEDLERVAKEEYGVKGVIESPLVIGGTSLNEGGSTYIFYHVSFKPARPLMLAHEIGHVAIGHLNEDKRQMGLFGVLDRENEADYFSEIVMGVSHFRHMAYREAEGLFLPTNLLRIPFIKNRERRRLTSLGVPLEVIRRL